MRKVLLACALAAFLTAPAMAGLEPSTFGTPMQANLGVPLDEGTVGLYGFYYTPTAGGYPYLWGDYKYSPVDASAYYHWTFAFHWPYITSVFVPQVQFAFTYDNAEFMIMNMNPAGAFGPNNFPLSATWQGPSFNPTSGLLQVGSIYTGVPLWCNPAAGTMPITGTGIYPFMQIDVHVKEALSFDSAMDAIVQNFAVLFRFTANSTGLWWTSGNIGHASTWGGHTSFSGSLTTPPNSFGVGVAPEPASLSLLGLAGLALGGGIWRRRR